MTVRFRLHNKQTSHLETLIKNFGTPPQKHSRQFPRIPSSKLIQTFPLRALAEIETTGLNRKDLRYSMICDVENISPTGILVSTENQNALTLQPGNTLFLTLDPRGWFPFQIAVKVQVCRIIDDFNLDNGNVFRHLGLKFIHFEEADRKAFMRLLKDILNQLKSEFSAN
jgi:hypothetical protein